MENDYRMSAQARIAASAPKRTYGKHKNKLLPLTGSQFLRNDVFGTVEKRILPKDFAQTTYQQSSADESPLSDAEPTRKQQSKRVATARMRRPRAPAKSVSIAKPTRREAGDVPGEHHPDTEGEEEGSRSSRSPSPHRDKHALDQHRSRRLAPSTQKKGKLKSAGVVRGRLPLNELVQVTGARNDDVFRIPDKNHQTLLIDPISSSAQQLIDAVGSEHSETTPAKRKAKAPLSAIRKRLRTPKSGHKSLEYLRRKYNAPQITPTGSQVRRTVGDGFERAELTPSHPFGYTVKHARRQREQLLAGLKALSLASGPLPEVVFTSESDPSQLKFAKHDTSDCHETASSGYVEPTTVTPSHGLSNPSSNRRVSLNYDVERAISAQLASVCAPRRQPSVALGSEDEVEEDDDDGDEAGEEDENDDEAADTYLDQDELPPEEHHIIVDEIREIQTHPPGVHAQPGNPASQSAHRIQSAQQPLAPGLNGFMSDTNRLRTPSFRRRTFSGRPLLNEVNEPIIDDFHIDDMLLDDEGGDDLTITHGSVEYITTNPSRDSRDFANVAMRSPSRDPPGKQTGLGRTSSAQPRSILKNSTPHISGDTKRPESTTANTCRNSMVDVEESRYFSAAKDQLDSTSTKQTIIRKKSNSRFYAPIEVPYSDEMVLETSPRKSDYTSRSQVHLLKRMSEALWTSSAAPVPQTDLGSLTRSVSRGNGTLSQSVRRRSGLKFQSPKKPV